MFIQCKKPFKIIKADRVALVATTTDMPQIPPYSTLAVDILDSNLDGPPLFFHDFLDHYHNDDGQLELIRNGDPIYEATRKPPNNEPENVISK